jgi:hypothetical protein
MCSKPWNAQITCDFPSVIEFELLKSVEKQRTEPSVKIGSLQAVSTPAVSTPGGSGSSLASMQRPGRLRIGWKNTNLGEPFEKSGADSRSLSRFALQTGDHHSSFSQRALSGVRSERPMQLKVSQ